MDFKEFLEKCKKYNDLYILEEFGNKEEIEKIVKQHGKKTKGRILIWNNKTKRVYEHAVYISNRGYSVLYRNGKILLKNFK